MYIQLISYLILKALFALVLGTILSCIYLTLTPVAERRFGSFWMVA